ncbi:MAG: DUF1826 domain-containing protein [Pseudomonadota bacterium]
MNPAPAENVVYGLFDPADRAAKMRLASGSKPGVLADIYDADISIAVWQRPPETLLTDAVVGFLAANPTLSAAVVVAPDTTHSALKDATRGTLPSQLSNDIAELVDMYCCLFNLERAGLRLATIDRAMCPRFHVDRMPCRLLTTYHGSATEWLPHNKVNRSKLGARSGGKPDAVSGLYQSPADIQQLDTGDVALIKGALWHDDETTGLVHRSPAVAPGERRLLLSLDFAD